MVSEAEQFRDMGRPGQWQGVDIPGVWESDECESRMGRGFWGDTSWCLERDAVMYMEVRCHE